jgi:hypothetical protein
VTSFGSKTSVSVFSGGIWGSSIMFD